MYEIERRSKSRLFEAKALASLRPATGLVYIRCKYGGSLRSANTSSSLKSSKIDTVLTWLGRAS